ncbi:hypothetical protein [Algicella marina]|uniref:Uncharacterized protein n=1 Tax=Algicella marina TaxID=2683284 RepID=A0A6P1T4S8_9RHOB|nr:hypothetical protein [Algicella marina]QHQ35552.1 hypothetical protein GO499_10350 [Algicella marina]
MTGAALLSLLLVLGLACAVFALVIRRAETAAPDPSDIQIRTGLGHMVTGILAWTALVALLVVAVFATGLILPAIAVAALLALARVEFGTRLATVYRSQTALSVTALLIAIVEWLALTSRMQVEPT